MNFSYSSCEVWNGYDAARTASFEETPVRTDIADVNLKRSSMQTWCLFRVYLLCAGSTLLLQMTHVAESLRAATKVRCTPVEPFVCYNLDSELTCKACSVWPLVVPYIPSGSSACIECLARTPSTRRMRGLTILMGFCRIWLVSARARSSRFTPSQ